MKDFTSKLSLYDILTQLISGFLILALFIPMPANGGETVTESYHWIFLLIFSYSIGIIYHRLLEWIRNISDKSIKECYIKLWIGTIFKRNYEKAIEKAQEKSKTGNNNLEKYYKAYYSIMDKPAYNTITFLETQEAFLRNITWIILFYLCCVIFSWLENGVAMKIMLEKNYAWILLLIIFFLILFARYQTQMKVYKAVWEAGKYLQNGSET